MEIYVFDHSGKVVVIRSQDVIDTTRIGKRSRYTTPHGIYYGPRNAKESAELHEGLGFVYIDTNIMINMNFIEKFTPNGIIVNSIFYPMSRRKLAHLKRKLRK